MSTFKVIIVKRSTWRGQPEEWSNGYHLNGTPPANRAAAEALFASMWAAERPFCGKETYMVQGYFYENPEGTVTIGKDYRDAPVGGATGSAFSQSAGGAPTGLEQSSLIRAMCGYTSKGKPRYVMKYFHGPIAKGGGDQVHWDTTGSLTAALAVFTNGTLPGSAKLCRPDGDLCATPTASPWVTTRTLKRRGKRPVKSGG